MDMVELERLISLVKKGEIMTAMFYAHKLAFDIEEPILEKAIDNLEEYYVDDALNCLEMVKLKWLNKLAKK